MSGYVKLHRGINDNELWLLEPFTKGQAWVDLFLNANWKDGVINIRGNIITIKRGQLGWSELTMAKRWRWSRDKVRRFLSYLEKSENIRQHKTPLTTIITICNYEEYQDSDTTDKTTDKTTEKQQKNNRRYTIEEGKEGKEGKEENLIIKDDEENSFFNMIQLNALAVRYLGWQPVMTQGRAEALRKLTPIFKDDVEAGFIAAAKNGVSSINYVIKAAQNNKTEATKPEDEEKTRECMRLYGTPF